MEGNYDAHFLDAWMKGEWACSFITYKNNFKYLIGLYVCHM
jgi:hypothetical protein